MPIDVTLEDFLSEVKARNTKADGSEKDPRLLARMDNDVCKACHARYKEKFPNQPFKIVCNGIYNEEDYKIKQEQYKEKYPEEEAYSLDEIREIYDPAFWASRHIVVKDSYGDLIPFVARWYQEETLKCTAKQKVERAGRGIGKTSVGVIEELHKAITVKNYEILVICPADAQSEKWYTEIMLQVENSPTIHDAIAQRKQQPFKLFRFTNGSTISIFTAGSASGRGANSIRSQSPRRVRCEEQDYLAEKDWEAIDPLLNRYTDSEFHGASTPTGARNKFYHMCTKFERFREFYFPVSVIPDWSDQKEQDCIREAKTMDRYRHEYLAEFGDSSQGVFKNIFIDKAKTTYKDPLRPHLKGYQTCKWDPNKRYTMGVDWNGEGTGTRIRVVEYDPSTRIRRVVDSHTTDEKAWTVSKSIDNIFHFNRKWHCEKVYIDKGFGQAQDEMIRLRAISAPPTEPLDRRLRDIIAIDFGAKLKTNKLAPIRDPNSKYLSDDEELERPTKPFMVDGTVMCLENGLFQFSDEDTLLDEQFRAYRVKNWSSHGYPSSYEVDGDCGDHDLDALMLALLAVEMTYGLFHTADEIKHLVKFVHIGSFGEGSSASTDNRLKEAGVPSRTNIQKESENVKLVHMLHGGATIAPAFRGGQTGYRGTSRTSMFRNKRSKTPWGSRRDR